MSRIGLEPVKISHWIDARTGEQSTVVIPKAEFDVVLAEVERKMEEDQDGPGRT